MTPTRGTTAKTQTCTTSNLRIVALGKRHRRIRPEHTVMPLSIFSRKLPLQGGFTAFRWLVGGDILDLAREAACRCRA